MAIAELLSIRARKGIACYGDAPLGDDEVAFRHRGFWVSPCTDEQLQTPAYLAGVSAVVFTLSADKPLQFVPHFIRHVKRLLDYDCQVFVRIVPVHGRAIVINIIDDLELPSMGLNDDELKTLGEWASESGRGDYRPPHVRVCDVGVTWSEISNLVASYPSRTAPNSDLVIHAKKANGEDIQFSDASNLLIRRAFWDCEVIHLVPMLDGLSGVQVYRAYAELAAGHPMPYFLKIGNRNEIFQEYHNNEQHVRSYIPFHLGPHLVDERCCLGSDEGIIVGYYVEESESLRDCASSGRGASAIACLFNRTLHGWYRKAALDHEQSLAAHLLPFVPNKIGCGRARRTQNLGATKSLSELRELFERCKSTPVLVGPIHGDLHATNVLVRATDAIVIDFAKHCVKPLVYDAACLEAGLVIEGFDDDKRDMTAWLESISPLYGELHRDGVPAEGHPKDPSFWLYGCVRQIRVYASQMERHAGQYAAALAVALLRKACKNRKFNNRKEDRRAAAYVLAERLLSGNSELWK